MVSITICTRTRPSTVYFEWLWLENVILFLLDSADILVTQIPGELKIVQGLQPSKLAHGFSIYLHPSHANRSGVESRITSITWTLYSSLFLLEWSLDIISQQGSLMCCSEKKYCRKKEQGSAATWRGVVPASVDRPSRVWIPVRGLPHSAVWGAADRTINTVQIK